MKLPYYLMDVFTRDRLSGNPLAVVLKADGLSTARMQALAGEFNLSETVFVRSPEVARHNARLCIFTPTTELPFAGHPTIGASVLLGLTTRVSAVRLELEIGSITAVFERVDKRTGLARIGLPRLPERISDGPGAEEIAARLGLAPEQIGCGPIKPAQFSAGVPFYLVPVRDPAALRDIALQRRGWSETFPGKHGAVYAFTATPDERGNDYAARMFGAGLGIGEDAGTGAAAAALIGLLAEQAEMGDGHHNLKLRQGWEMGRPSLIELQVNIAGGKLQHGGIGGAAVVLAEGMIDLSE
ncbi:PhzF family phenazine biosynthesis protein [Pelagibacterium montanilacus]|uniref:PhzF family phenazine biosynthesis protein n=1 Tax=Pelagibacterium montanilacus TaxID=2185280 RepID=UPI000F8E52C2|nr:PhzF family phenazine biosynthesis protein [Pelagibacterium montanilacus]